jgi:hypothetical protein
LNSTSDFDPKKLIAALLSQGIAPQVVAKQLGVKLADVQKYSVSNKPKPQVQAQSTRKLGGSSQELAAMFGLEFDPKTAASKRKTPDFKWTPDNESILKSMWAQGHSSGEIAQNLGTTTDSVDKKVKRLIGSGWDGKDPSKKFSPAKSTTKPASAGRPLPSTSGSLSSQVRNVVAGNGQSPARSKSFGQFAKRYVASGAAKSLEANFGLLGAWAASKLMAEQSDGKLAPGSSGEKSRGGGNFDKQAQVITSGVSQLGATIARGTASIFRNITLSGEKTQTALGEIRDNLKRLNGGSAPTVSARSGPTHPIASAAAAGGLGLLGGIAGGAAIGGIAKLFSGGASEAKIEGTPTAHLHVAEFHHLLDGPPYGVSGHAGRGRHLPLPHGDVQRRLPQPDVGEPRRPRAWSTCA